MRHVAFLTVMTFLATACASVATPQVPTLQPATIGAVSTPTNIVTENAPTETSAPPAGPTNATAFPDASRYKWTAVVSGLVSPIDIQFPDDGTGRMFILEQAGRIRIAENNQLVATPFLDLTDRVGSAGNEQGLLGLAFDPKFKDNGYFYVNYTDTNGNTVIARFKANGDTADPASEKALIHVNQPFPNHNGGVLTFGPDGYLYAGLGDGGSAGDPFGNGQNKNVLLGKILRIDVEHGDLYTVPSDNPFGNEIWAYGLRNPWRISFDKSTGDLYIADVGQDNWEEVDFLPAGSPGGSNFGWNFTEGNHHYTGQPPAALQITHPVAEYSHADGSCSITGGYVYRGQMPEWQGIYLYGDFCTGKISGLIRPSDPSSGTWQSQALFASGASITTFGQDPSGEVYFADRRGTIYRLEK